MGATCWNASGVKRMKFFGVLIPNLRMSPPLRTGSIPGSFSAERCALLSPVTIPSANFACPLRCAAFSIRSMAARHRASSSDTSNARTSSGKVRGSPMTNAHPPVDTRHPTTVGTALSLSPRITDGHCTPGKASPK